MSRETFTIGALSDQTGVNIETIRYYERVGLVPPPPRNSGGHRIYDRRLLKRLTFIRRGRELGFSLGDIRALLAMADGGVECRDVQRLTLQHLDGIRSKIADLRRLERTLSQIADQCTGDRAPECPVIEALSREKVQSARP